MGDTDDSPHTLSPHEAFAAIGNDKRVEILRTVWEPRPSPLSFVELYDRVQIDDTGQFNYHLTQLLGHFVKQGEGGYQLRNAGREVVLAIRADDGSENPLTDPVTVGVECYHCETPIVALYEDGWVHVECANCEQIYAGCPFPSAGLQNRSVEEILAVFAEYHRYVFRFTTQDICPSCTSRVISSAQFRSEGEHGPNPIIKYECTHCGLGMFSTPGLAIIDHPDVVRFHAEHDIDLSAVPVWELEWCYDEQYVDIRSNDPLETLVRIPLGSHQLDVTLDESFAITGITKNAI